MIPEVRHALVTDILLAGHWYAVLDSSYTQRGEMFNARLSEFPERGGPRLDAADVVGRLSDLQAWKFKQG
ncbi:MAG: hypothetical protein AB7N24_02335 [Dehalococcoidia bacterium]